MDIQRFALARTARSASLSRSVLCGGMVRVKSPRAHICSSASTSSRSRSSTQVGVSAIAISGRADRVPPGFAGAVSPGRAVATDATSAAAAAVTWIGSSVSSQRRPRPPFAVRLLAPDSPMVGA